MQATGDRSDTTGMALAIGGGALLAIGSFMTWATASIDTAKFAQALGVDAATIDSAFQTQGVGTSTTVSGFDGDGKITLVLGLLAIAGGVVIAMKKNRKVGAALAVVGGGLGGLLALYDMTQAKDDALAEASAAFGAQGLSISVDEFFTISIGIGLWVCLIGGIIALVGGGLSLRGGAAAGGALPMGDTMGAAPDTGWGGGSSAPAAPAAPAPSATPVVPPPAAEPSPPAPPPTSGATPQMPDTSNGGSSGDAAP